jgi:hypothetical protein
MARSVTCHRTTILHIVGHCNIKEILFFMDGYAKISFVENKRE